MMTAGGLGAQVSEHSRDYEAFTGVEVSGAFSVELEEGESYSLSITADEPLHDFIEAYVEDGVLKVSLDERDFTPEVRRHYRSRLTEASVCKAVITVPSALRECSLKGKTMLGKVEGGVFAADSAEFRLTDDARIEGVTLSGSETVCLSMEKRSSADMAVEAGSFSAELAGGSSLKFDGSCDEMTLSLSSNSSCVTRSDCGVMNVSAKGTSRTILNGSSDEVRYTLSGSADVNAENLKTVDARVSMSGFCSLTEAASGSVFLDLSNGAKLSYKNSPIFFISAVRNSTILRYYETEDDDSTGRTL